MAKATLINSAGQKVVVEAGSQDAKNYFGQGYAVMGPDGKAPAASSGVNDLRDIYGGKVNESFKTSIQVPGPDAPIGPAGTADTTPIKGTLPNVISSSDPIVKDEQATTAMVNNLNTPSISETSAQKASDDYMKILNDQNTKLEDSRKSQIDELNKFWEQQQRNLEDAQTRETGTQSVALQRIGGYLGGSASAIGAQRNLAETHRQEISALQAKKAAAINAANAAIDDKQFQLAKDKAKEVKDVEAEIEKRRKEFFDQTLALTQEQRMTDSSTFNIVKDIPAGTTIKLNGRTYTGIKSADMDPFFKGSDIVQLMKTIPSGKSQEIKDPNTGTVYTIQGLATEDPSIKALSSTDDRGNVILTRYNLNTGEVLSQTSLGAVGKSKTAPANTTINIRKETGALVSSITDIFMKDKGADKKINPSTYAAQQAAFLASGSGTANDFKKMFPPAEWLNTNNPDALPFFQTSADALDSADSEDPFAN